MNIFEVQNVSEQTIDLGGMNLDLFVKITNSLSKTKYKTLDAIMPFNIIVGPKLSGNTEYVGKLGKIDYALVKNGEIFQIDNLFAVVTNTQLVITQDKEKLTTLIQHAYPNLTEQENKALHWLEHGRVGSSSLSMCYALFPNIRKLHNALKEETKNIPYDSSDFKRCLDFVDHVGVTDLTAVGKINPVWHEIVSNWSDLIANYNSDDKKLVRNKLQEIQKISMK